MTQLQIREMTVRSVNEDKREVVGMAVPYGVKTNVGGYEEMFDRGAFGDAVDVKLFYGHAEPIGLVTKGEDTEDGYVITASISKTARGDEVYTLLRDGVLNKFSVGFLPVEDRIDDNDVVVRTKADLKEVSVVAFPAYAGANVSEVRNEKDSDDTVTENTNDKKVQIMENTIEVADVADLRATVADMERRMAVMADADAAVSAPQYRSGGEFLKALHANSQEARAFATQADSTVHASSWIGGAMKFLDENRNMVNFFTKAPLPSSGNVIEFAAMPAGTGTVDKQAVEGDLLPYMEVALDTATANVYTYGGYSSLSRQAIDRSDVSYLEMVLRYQTLQYAKATNKVVRDTLVANATAGGVLAADTPTAWIELVNATSDAISNATGLGVDVVMVSGDVFARLAKMVDTTGRPVFVVNGDGQNTWGNVNLKGRTANIAGLQVIVDPALAANSAYAVNSNAITVFESAGAPFRLQDEDILRLTKDFSLYGYMAVGVTAAPAAVSLDVDLVA